MRLTPAAFYGMELRDFVLAVQGFQELEPELELEAWELTLWQAAVSLQPYAKQGKGIQPTELIRFPWDKKKKRKTSKAENAQLAAILKASANGKVRKP